MIESIKNQVFKALHLGRGYPLMVRGRRYRFDESLRRFKTDGEEIIQEVLETRLAEGGFFVDIGANFGLHTLLGCDLVGPTGKVLAVEPVPANLALLRRNLQLNNYSTRTRVMEVALTADKSDSVEMTVEDGLSPAASLSLGIGGKKISVPTSNLDTILIDYEKTPDLIKIDVEGAEHEVLKGAINTLRKGPPLLIEVHRFSLGSFSSSSENLSAFLAEYGYQEQRLSELKSIQGQYHHSLFTVQQP